MIMNKKKKGDKKFYYKFFKLLKLEATTKYGRVNLAGVAIIALFCIIYTATDIIKNVILIIGNTIKSVALKQDLPVSEEGVSVLEAVIPIFIAFILCLCLLYKYDKVKSSDTDEENS